MIRNVPGKAPTPAAFIFATQEGTAGINGYADGLFGTLTPVAAELNAEDHQWERLVTGNRGI
jgi:hypothetical protein